MMEIRRGRGWSLVEVLVAAVGAGILLTLVAAAWSSLVLRSREFEQGFAATLRAIEAASLLRNEIEKPPRFGEPVILDDEVTRSLLHSSDIEVLPLPHFRRFVTANVVVGSHRGTWMRMEDDLDPRELIAWVWIYQDTDAEPVRRDVREHVGQIVRIDEIPAGWNRSEVAVELFVGVELTLRARGGRAIRVGLGTPAPPLMQVNRTP